VTAAYDEAHRRAQQQLAGNVSARLAAMIAGLPAAREQAAMDVYNQAAARLVAGGQRRAAQLAIGYLSLIVDGQPGRAAPSPDRAIADVRVSPQSAVAYSPILRLWYLIDQGLELGDAKLAAGSYADELATNDLHAAQRAGLDEAAHAADRRIEGWQKQLAGDACEWCRSVATKTYASAESVPFHPRDACSVSPVVA
jgi:hypothetical protein